MSTTIIDNVDKKNRIENKKIAGVNSSAEGLLPTCSLPASNASSIIAESSQDGASPNPIRSVVKNKLGNQFTYPEINAVYPFKFNRSYHPNPNSLLGTLIDIMI